MNMIEQFTDLARKYRVHSSLGVWTVSLEQRSLDSFADAVEAAEAACRRARKDAHDGAVAIVSVETSPRELHCFTPDAGCTKPSAAKTPPYLRLLARD
jgi:hypothetical protein